MDKDQIRKNEFMPTEISTLVLERLGFIIDDFYNIHHFTTPKEDQIAISMKRQHYRIGPGFVNPENFIREAFKESLVTLTIVNNIYSLIIKGVDHRDSWARIK